MSQDNFFLMLTGGIVVAKLPNNGTVPLVTHSSGEYGTPITTVLYEYDGILRHQTTSFRLTNLGTVKQVRESEELAQKIFPAYSDRATELMAELIKEQKLEDHYLVLCREA